MTTPSRGAAAAPDPTAAIGHPPVAGTPRPAPAFAPSAPGIASAIGRSPEDGDPRPAPADAPDPTSAIGRTVAAGTPHPVPAASPAPAAFPAARPRRLRATPALRRLVAETALTPSHLVLPLFVAESLSEPRPIASMPGVVQHTLGTLREAAAGAAAAGLPGVMLFGVPASRDPLGSGADDPDGILNRAIAAVREEVGDAVVVMADTCLDEFTSHGHCGVLTAGGEVDNDATLARYQAMALAQAEAGAGMLGLSGMMDGQVAAARSALDAAGHTGVALLAYAAKYASALYGPFREAVDSQLQGDRRTYQQDPANRRESARELRLDLAEGADVVMVKPASLYLDVVADAAAISGVPVAAYQVSGEYAMIEAAAQHGWIDRRAAILESLTCIRRAGAQFVLTYWATEVAGWLREG